MNSNFPTGQCWALTKPITLPCTKAQRKLTKGSFGFFRSPITLYVCADILVPLNGWGGDGGVGGNSDVSTLFFSLFSAILSCTSRRAWKKRVRLQQNGQKLVLKIHCNCCTHFEMQLREYGHQVLGHGMLGRLTVMAHLDQRLLGAVRHRQTRFALFQTVLHLHDKTGDDINIPHGLSMIGNFFSNSFNFPAFCFNYITRRKRARMLVIQGRRNTR